MTELLTGHKSPNCDESEEPNRNKRTKNHRALSMFLSFWVRSSFYSKPSTFCNPERGYPNRPEESSGAELKTAHLFFSMTDLS